MKRKNEDNTNEANNINRQLFSAESGTIDFKADQCEEKGLFIFQNPFQNKEDPFLTEFDFSNFQEEQESESVSKLFENFEENTMKIPKKEEPIPRIKEVTPSKAMKEILELMDKPFTNALPESKNYTIKDLKNKKVVELKELIENIKYEKKVFYHWSWLQYKQDLIEVLLDPGNNKFLEKKKDFD